MSTAMNIPEKTITLVIDHQFTSLIENMPSCNSLEISGFGKFIFHEKKAVNMMKRYLKDQENMKELISTAQKERIRKNTENKLSRVEMSIKLLNQKLQTYENQFCTNLRGVEKLPDSSRGDKGTDPESSSRENENM